MLKMPWMMSNVAKRKIAREKFHKDHRDEYKVVEKNWPSKNVQKNNSLAELSKFVQNDSLLSQIIALWIETKEDLLSKKDRKDFSEIKAPVYKAKIFKLLNL